MEAKACVHAYCNYLCAYSVSKHEDFASFKKACMSFAGTLAGKVSTQLEILETFDRIGVDTISAMLTFVGSDAFVENRAKGSKRLSDYLKLLEDCDRNFVRCDVPAFHASCVQYVGTAKPTNKRILILENLLKLHQKPNLLSSILDVVKRANNREGIIGMAQSVDAMNESADERAQMYINNGLKIILRANTNPHWSIKADEFLDEKKFDKAYEEKFVEGNKKHVAVGVSFAKKEVWIAAEYVKDAMRKGHKESVTKKIQIVCNYIVRESKNRAKPKAPVNGT